MNGNKDLDNVALADGNLYFVEWSGFEAYLAEASKHPEEVSLLALKMYLRYLVLRFRCRLQLAIT